jgi:hypothetical protein
MDKYGFKTFDLNPGSKTPAARGWQASASVEHVSKDNYGILLDEQFIVVDVDYPERLPKGFLDSIGPTWSQKTKRGFHYLYKVPDGFKGKNGKIPNNAGDLKCNGYIVGPGSVVDGFKYEVFVPTEPKMAPQWLLDLCKDNRSESVSTDIGTEQNLQIKEGEGRNQILTRVAGSLRGLGLGTEQVKRLVRHTNGEVCQPPLAESEIRNTIDKSIEKWEPGSVKEKDIFLPKGWLTAADIPRVQPPTTWWEWGFIPKNVLTLQYGGPGIGKSTFAAWVAAKVTNSGGRFGVVTSEDPFSLFANRAIIMGANPNLLLAPKGSGLLFPRDTDKLEKLVRLLSLDFLYFDAIYDHFESSETKNAAEKARQSLSGLARIATETGCTVMGTFHKNKSGQFMGSTEMENVCRVLLEVTRGGDPDNPNITIGVKKSNFKRPSFKLQFGTDETEIVDPVTGEVQQEEQEDGSIAPAKLSFCRKIANLGANCVNIDSITEYSSDTAQDLIVSFLGNQETDSAAAREVKQYVMGRDISESTCDRAIKSLVEEESIVAEGGNRNRIYRLLLA